MGIPKFFSRIIPLVSVAVFVAGLSAVFLFRPPAVIVTDPSFDLLYGAGRARLKQAALSVLHFRRVIPVQVVESAGPEIAAAAVNAVSSAPKAVFFSGLFSAAARRYWEERPDVPVYLWEGGGFPAGERRSENAEAGPRAARVDRESALFRAGIAAAFFSRGKTGAVCVYQDRVLDIAERAAFEKGLETGGFTGTPEYRGLNSGFTDASCAVVMGAATAFLEENRTVPVLLFSWVDPALTPESVKVIFDDSVWAALGGILRLPEGGSSSLLFSSNIIIPDGRITPGKDAVSLKQLMKTKLPVGINSGNL